MEKQFKKRHSFRKSRRLFSMLCSICLMTMMLPGMVYADTGENVEMYSEDSYNIWIGDIQVTSANAGNVLAGDAKNDGKVTYDPATKTLTLNGADITVTTEDPSPSILDYESEALKIEEDELTLHLNGENRITLTANANLTHQTSVINCTGALTINGSGSLEIFNDTFSDTDIHGLQCKNTMTVSDVDLIVRNDGTEGSMLGFVIDRFIQNSGTVSSHLGTAGGEINSMLLAGYAEINGGRLMAQAGGAKVLSCGIYIGGAGGMTINGGTVLAEGNGTDEGSLSVGIYALGDNIIINGGNLMVQSGGAGACYGIWSISGGFIQNGGTVSVKSGNAGKGNGSIGLLVSDAAISSGTLEVFAQSGDDLSGGIVIYFYGEDGDAVFSDKTPDLSKYTYALVTAGSDKNSAVEVEVPDAETYRQAYIRIEPYQCTDHNWAATWEHDADGHWHLCTNRGCTTKSQKVSHTFVEGSPDPAPTLQTEGQRIDTCSICGETKTVVLPKLTDAPPHFTG